MNNETYYMSAGEVVSATEQYSKSLTESMAGLNDVVVQLDDFVNSSTNELQGEVWDKVRGSMVSYKEYVEELKSLNQEIDESMANCLKKIREFLSPDDDLNTADLPKFETEKTNLETEISNLQAENLTLSQVPASVCVGYDEYDQPIYEANEPAYSNAQAQIAANNKRIEDILQPALEETIRLINKINKFMNEVLPAINQELDRIYQKAVDYANKVNDIVNSLPDNSSVKNLYTNTSSRTYDMNTTEGRFLYIYDQLTEKYGFSDWGARAILAQMHGTNSKFLADRFQSDLPTNAGYGLCQWEYLKYGGSSDHAQMMEDWCRANNLDHTTIDGQLAWLDHFLPIVSEGYHVDLYNELKNATEEDYYAMVCKFGTYHQGSQGDQYKNFNRAYDGNLLYRYFPLIDERNSYKTVASSIAQAPTFSTDSTSKGGITTLEYRENPSATYSSTPGSAYMPSVVSVESPSIPKPTIEGGHDTDVFVPVQGNQDSGVFEPVQGTSSDISKPSVGISNVSVGTTDTSNVPVAKIETSPIKNIVSESNKTVDTPVIRYTIQDETPPVTHSETPLNSIREILPKVLSNKNSGTVVENSVLSATQPVLENTKTTLPKLILPTQVDAVESSSTSKNTLSTATGIVSGVGLASGGLALGAKRFIEKDREKEEKKDEEKEDDLELE